MKSSFRRVRRTIGGNVLEGRVRQRLDLVADEEDAQRALGGVRRRRPACAAVSFCSFAGCGIGGTFHGMHRGCSGRSPARARRAAREVSRHRESSRREVGAEGLAPRVRLCKGGRREQRPRRLAYWVERALPPLRRGPYIRSNPRVDPGSRSPGGPEAVIGRARRSRFDSPRTTSTDRRRSHEIATTLRGRARRSCGARGRDRPRRNRGGSRQGQRTTATATERQAGYRQSDLPRRDQGLRRLPRHRPGVLPRVGQRLDGGRAEAHLRVEPHRGSASRPSRHGARSGAQPAAERRTTSLRRR